MACGGTGRRCGEVGLHRGGTAGTTSWTVRPISRLLKLLADLLLLQCCCGSCALTPCGCLAARSRQARGTRSRASRRLGGDCPIVSRMIFGSTESQATRHATLSRPHQARTTPGPDHTRPGPAHVEQRMSAQQVHAQTGRREPPDILWQLYSMATIFYVITMATGRRQMASVSSASGTMAALPAGINQNVHRQRA